MGHHNALHSWPDWAVELRLSVLVWLIIGGPSRWGCTEALSLEQEDSERDSVLKMACC